MNEPLTPERRAEIEALLNGVPDEELFVKGNYDYWMIRGKYTSAMMANVPSAHDESARAKADFIAAAPQVVRDMIDACAAQQQRIEQLEAGLKPFAKHFAQVPHWTATYGGVVLADFKRAYDLLHEVTDEDSAANAPRGGRCD